MNKYIVFAGENYYAKGGIWDFIDEFNRKEDAIKFAKELIGKSFDYNSKTYDWWHIVNKDTMEVVIMSECQAYDGYCNEKSGKHNAIIENGD